MVQWVRTKVILTSKADPQMEGIFKNLAYKVMLRELKVKRDLKNKGMGFLAVFSTQENMFLNLSDNPG
jgi:hypothetical protein